MKRIGVDIDGTITTMDSVLSVFNRETGKNLEMKDITEYDIGKCYGISKKESGSIWEKYGEEMVQRSIPIWDLDDFMKGWVGYGQKGKERNEIIIITARPESSRESTEQWLKSNGVRYSELYLGYGKKIDAVREHFLDVLVDDKADNIKDIDEDNLTECEGYLVDQPYNQWYKTDKRVYTQGVLNR